nr:MAG TPA: hypothetical protein [Caudoviricetes sp.]
MGFSFERSFLLFSFLRHALNHALYIMIWLC